MPVVHIVPVTHGMTKDEVLGRIQSGWVMAGRQAVHNNGLIVDPSQAAAPTGVIDADIWVLNEPMAPISLIAARLVESYEAGGDVDTLDDLARVLTGQGIILLKGKMDEAKAAANVRGS